MASGFSYKPNRAAARKITGFRVQPFAAWVIGAAGAYAVHHWAPQLSEAIVGLVLAAVAYLVVEKVVPEPAGRTVTPAATAAEVAQ